MRVVFKLPVKEAIVISVSDKDSEFLLDDMNVQWETDEEKHIIQLVQYDAFIASPLQDAFQFKLRI